MFWKKKKTEEVSLLEQVIEITSRGDDAEIEQFCVNNKAGIRKEFKNWTTAPEKYRSSPELVQMYGNAVLSVAQLFLQNGDATLMQALQQKECANPLDEWVQKLDVAQELQSRNEFADSVPLLEQTISEIGKMLGGTAVDYYLPRAYGMLGSAHYNMGNIKIAVEQLQTALKICEEINDEEGVQVYKENLDFIVRNA